MSIRTGSFCFHKGKQTQTLDTEYDLHEGDKNRVCSGQSGQGRSSEGATFPIKIEGLKKAAMKAWGTCRTQATAHASRGHEPDKPEAGRGSVAMVNERGK